MVADRRRPRARPPRALSIAGSDGGGGAGVQADLMTFAARGVYGTSVVTALTVQGTRGVTAVCGVAPAFVRAQLDAVLEDIGADAVKTGMLHDARTVAAVADGLAAHGVRRLVVDPVLCAKNGTRLLAAGAERVVRDRLLPLAAVVTPNLDEAAALVGFPVASPAAMEAAARALVRAGARAAVVTGGHLGGDAAIDVLVVGSACRVLRGTRIAAVAPHGTGCAFSATLTAELAKGGAIEDAVRAAKRYVTASIRRARVLGPGPPILGHLVVGSAARRHAAAVRRRRTSA